jgi:hypothetical protein
MVVVTNRTQATLENEIANYILPGSHIISEHIISDGWAVYVHIDQMQGAVYTHETVIHDVNFVNPDNQDIHTQNSLYGIYDEQISFRQFQQRKVDLQHQNHQFHDFGATEHKHHGRNSTNQPQ